MRARQPAAHSGCAQGGELVLHPRLPDRERLTRDQAVALQAAQGLGEHFLADAVDLVAKLPEPLRPGAGLASFTGGTLLKSLAAEGLSPDDIDTVVFTHLHHDHVGWTSNSAPAPNAGSRPPVTALTFGRARHLVASAEWDYWDGSTEMTGPDPDAVQAPLRAVIDYLPGGEEIVPGLRAVPTPGHTPGHTSLLVTAPSAERRVLILGDVMNYQDAQTVIAGGHFAGSVFGHFLPATLKHGWAAIAADGHAA
jgi:glyoxylase-like metal-dependent hydrolase (beta-lactamase superfamily II)